MKKLLVLAVLAAAPALGGCHSCEGQTRFWSVNGGQAYTVDTIGAPLGQKVTAEFVNGAGMLVPSPETLSVAQISEAQYLAATSGADYSVSYCPIMKSCWALPKAK